jgi:hypothetical protein
MTNDTILARLNFEDTSRTRTEIAKLSTLVEQHGVSKEVIEAWILACKSIEQLTWLRQCMSALAVESESFEGALKDIDETIGETSFSKDNWIEAGMIFLEKTKMTLEDTKAERIFSYISCCTEVTKYGPTHGTLPDIVGDMITFYGFENRDKME